MKKDCLVCEHCSLYRSSLASHCLQCAQPLVRDAAGAISLWRLGGVRPGILGPMMAQLRDAFGVPCVLQPGFLDERPSRRPHWRGISSGVFLAQVHRRHRRGSLVSLGVTEFNIVPSSRYNFLFGYAYMGDPAAVVSLCALAADNPPEKLLAKRAGAIAIHEIGHTLKLDHHAYEEAVDCVMCGDETQDSIDHIDEGGATFCAACRRAVARALAARRVRA